MLPDFWDDSDGRRARRRYAGCGLVVVLVFGFVAARVESRETGSAVAERESAVLVDLPPAVPSSAPQGDQMDALEVPPPVAASAKPEAPAAETPAKPIDRSEVKLPAPEPPERTTEKSQDQPKQMRSAAAQPAQVLGGSETPIPAAPAIESEAARHASARAISRWQQAMVAKLESAKRVSTTRPVESGSVEISFVIDRRGHLVRRAISKPSGSRKLDDLALKLIDAAAPFAPPPPAMDDAALAFTVPIHFNRR